MKKISNLKKKGFTLVELIAVMAIVLILALMIVPSITNYKNKAIKTDIVSTGRVILNAVDAINAEGLDEKIKPDTTVGILLDEESEKSTKDYLDLDDRDRAGELISSEITVEQLRRYVNKKEQSGVKYDSETKQLVIDKK